MAIAKLLRACAAAGIALGLNWPAAAIEPQKCYVNLWLQWIDPDLIGYVCPPGPALGDPPDPNLPEMRHAPPREHPPICGEGDGRPPDDIGGSGIYGDQETARIGQAELDRLRE